MPDTPKQPEVNLQVRGEDPRDAMSAVFSNFIAVSRVATEVQFEFIFLDLNMIANLLKTAKPADNKPGALEVTGKTVAKVIVPAAAFLQIREHLLKMLEDIESEIGKAREAQNEYNRTR